MLADVVVLLTAFLLWQVLGTARCSEMSRDLTGWDADGSGAIGFEEFKRLMKAATPPKDAPNAES